MAGLGIQGIQGIGGLGGRPRRQPTGGMQGGAPFGPTSGMGGGLSMVPTGGAAQRGMIPPYAQQPQQRLVRGVAPPQGYYDPGAMGDLRSGVGMAGMANKGYEWLSGSPSGLGGGLGLAGGALGGAGAMSRVANGTATPMDYATLARLGYSAYSAAGTGAAGAAAGGAGAAGAGGAGASGAGAAGAGAGAGMAAWALPAAVVLGAVMAYNAPGPSNEEVVSGLVNTGGGAQNFMKNANTDIASWENPNYKDVVAKALSGVQGGLGGGEGGPSAWEMYQRSGLNTPGGLNSAILNNAFQSHYPGGTSQLRGALSEKYDPHILGQMVGQPQAEDLRNRYMAATNKWQTGLMDYLKANPQQINLQNPYLPSYNAYESSGG